MKQYGYQRQWIVAATFALFAIVAMTGCSQNNNGPNTNQRMMVSSENFKLGLDDGRRDAKNAWNDSGAYWLWLWAAEETYQAGYKQGWREGRAQVSYEQQAETGRELNEQHENEDG